MSTYKIETFNKLSIQSAKTPREAKNAPVNVQGKDFSDRYGDHVFYAFLYPNICINRYGGIMDTNFLVPLGVDKTAIIYDYFFDGKLSKDKEFIHKSLAASEVVQVEDTKVCEGVQRGLSSIGYDKGRYAPTKETATWHFHTLLANDLRHTD